jgi:hypothetical protein
MIGGTFAATYPTASGVRSWRPAERQPSGAWQEFECGFIAKNGKNTKRHSPNADTFSY